MSKATMREMMSPWCMQRVLLRHACQSDSHLDFSSCTGADQMSGHHHVAGSNHKRIVSVIVWTHPWPVVQAQMSQSHVQAWSCCSRAQQWRGRHCSRCSTRRWRAPGPPGGRHCRCASCCWTPARRHRRRPRPRARPTCNAAWPAASGPPPTQSRRTLRPSSRSSHAACQVSPGS